LFIDSILDYDKNSYQDLGKTLHIQSGFKGDVMESTYRFRRAFVTNILVVIFLLFGCAPVSETDSAPILTETNVPPSPPPPSTTATAIVNTPESTSLPVLQDELINIDNLENYQVLEPNNLMDIVFLGIQSIDPDLYKAEIKRFIWSEDGERILTCTETSSSGYYQVFDLIESAKLAEIEVEKEVCEKIGQFDRWLELSQDGELIMGLKYMKKLIVPGKSSEPTIYNSLGGDQISTLDLPEGGFLEVADFSPGGEILAVGMEFWDHPASTEDASVEGGTWIDEPYAIEFFDVQTGTHIETFRRQTLWYVHYLEYSSQGDYLAASSFDVTDVWPVEGGSGLSLDCPGALITFSPVDDLIALTCQPRYEDQYSVLWDLTTGDTVRFSEDQLLDYTQLKYSPDGLLLTDTKEVKVWQGRTGEHLYTLPYILRTALDVHFTHDGRFITVLNKDGRLQLFGVK